jgi:putative tricarboxylic transport membrane protein
MGDILVAFFFGLLGYFMKKFDYSRAVLILGLVLGHITEKNLILSVRLFGTNFWMRPIALILLSIILFTVLFQWGRKRRKGR